ncbi:MAG: hypothetical protein F4Y92_04395 [Dehalococcoidia bacterium]|nr:hypothetical protein [Dehalococcoidia bacterium]
MNAPEPAPSAPEPLHWTQVANGGGLLVLAALFVAGARAMLKASWLFAPVALVLLGLAALAGWGAAVQLSGGVHTDDHPWV